MTTKFATTALAVASLGVAGAAEATPIKTKVSISAEEGGFSGSVSNNKTKCEADRKVRLFLQKGAKPSTEKDSRVGSDLSNDEGDWSVKTGKEGKFYAHVKKTKTCAGNFSKTVNSED